MKAIYTIPIVLVLLISCGDQTHLAGIGAQFGLREDHSLVGPTTTGGDLSGGTTSGGTSGGSGDYAPELNQIDDKELFNQNDFTANMHDIHTGEDIDRDGSAIIYSCELKLNYAGNWSPCTQHSSITFDQQQGLLEATQLQQGLYRFRITGTDDSNMSDISEFNLNVTLGNIACDLETLTFKTEHRHFQLKFSLSSGYANSVIPKASFSDGSADQISTEIDYEYPSSNTPPFTTTIKICPEHISSIAYHYQDGDFKGLNTTLDNIFPNKLNRFTNLQALTLNGTYDFANQIGTGIKGPIPDNFFDNATSLKGINFYGHQINNFEGVKIPSLETLTIIYGQFDQTIDKDFIDSFPKLRQLSLSYNKIESIEEDAFQNATELAYLYLDRNLISSPLSPNLFTNLTKLNTLNLNQNKFTGNLSSSFFSSMEKLEHLYLEGNNELNITINSQLFANIPKIRVFRTAFHKSIQLELSDDLLLHNNDLKNLSIANWGTDGCQSNGNLSENIFKNQEKIEYLLIKGCDIEGQIHQNLFKYNTELINLNLSQNKLSGAIPANLFQNNTKIKRIALENNELSGSIPAGLFEETSELSELSLASNKLSGTIPSQLFQPLKNIKKLSVSYNELSGFAPLDTTVLKEEVTLAFHTNKFTSDQLDSYLVNFNQAITSCAASSGGNSFFPWMLANNGITMENQDPLASITNLSAKQELIDKGCEVHHD